MNSSFAFSDISTDLDPSSVMLCFSHLRWDFVHQRPQHLLTEASRSYRVYYIEEPLNEPCVPHFRLRMVSSNLVVLTPVFDSDQDPIETQHKLISDLQHNLGSASIIHWYYTPLALRFTRDLPNTLCVYDCMDELSVFKFASPDIPVLERELLKRVDLVFTGGQSLFSEKRKWHEDVHCFPSSVDVQHFGRARMAIKDPVDQLHIQTPRVGFAGVIDERIDLDLVAHAAKLLPDVSFVMLGPLAKIDERDLPRGQNIHWLGRKDYSDLPSYMANWQAAWMPFALNEATRFISPTKTPEYLAAGLPVTSTAIRDVVATYGQRQLVLIADAETMADQLQQSLKPPSADWLNAVDDYLGTMSWTSTWRAMHRLMKSRVAPAMEAEHV